MKCYNNRQHTHNHACMSVPWHVLCMLTRDGRDELSLHQQLVTDKACPLPLPLSVFECGQKRLASIQHARWRHRQRRRAVDKASLR